MSLINKDDLDSVLKVIVKGAVDSSVGSALPRVEEAYRHDSKPFKQVSEFVSQKTKTSHNELYKGYIDSLNKVSAELDTVDKTDVNSRHSAFRNLKLAETYNLNATWLHELYFANCFDPHSEIEMDSMSFLKLERDFGSFEDWQRDFMACALGSQAGWAVTGYHMFLRRYVNALVDGHSGHCMVGFYPVIVVDMWEHAYYRDYLNDKKSYLVSQMREFSWKVIEERFNKAEKIAQVLK